MCVLLSIFFSIVGVTLGERIKSDFCLKKKGNQSIAPSKPPFRIARGTMHTREKKKLRTRDLPHL